MPDLPKFSVVIPACERPESLRRCLARLDRTRPGLSSPSYEVIVSDDSRSDEIHELVAGEFPFVRWVRGPRRGPAANRNCGAKLAAGEWLVFTDDDCVPDPNWLLGYDRAIESGEAEWLEGKTICPDRTRALLEERIENVRGGNFWTCNLAVRRRVFESMGGFDEDFLEPAHEDMEFAFRAKARGFAVRFVPEALVEHPARRLTLRQWWRRTLMVRWFSLYLLKTREGWTDRNLLLVLVLVAVERAANLLRENWALLRERRAAGFLRTCFLLCWKSAVFPLLLPYVLYWEIRFRNALAKRPLRTSPGSLRAPVTS